MRDRVLVVTERYWPDGSGGELATYLIVGLLKEFFDVVVVTGSRNPLRYSGVEYIYEPLLSKWEKPILWLNTVRLANKDRFRKLLRDADIVYIPRFAFPIIPYAKSLGKKVVVHLHGYIPISYTAVVLAPFEKHKDRIVRDDILIECMKGAKYCIAAATLWWLPKLARYWISQADKVICVSKRQASIVLDALPELEGKIEVMYNPLPQEIVSVNPAKEPSETPTFLYVGGDSYVKGFDILLQTVKIVDKKGVKAKLILANRYGAKAMDKIQNLKQRLNSVSIEVAGKITHRKLLEMHSYAWALLFPSILEETFGYAIVEAMTLGTIPIASKVGGIPEIVEGTAAERFLFQLDDIKDFISKIERLASLSITELIEVGESLRSSIIKKFDNAIRSNLINAFKND